MKGINKNYAGQSRWWWVVLIVGIMLVAGGFAYWLWPVAGYTVAAQLFGWLLILTGVVQLCAAASPTPPSGWGWWIAGGVIDIFIGFMMVRSIMLSEAVLPYFLAIIFIFWGIESIVGSAMRRRSRSSWWLGIINGILLCIIGFLFLEAGWGAEIAMVSFLTSIAFIYWGLTVAITGYEMKPAARE